MSVQVRKELGSESAPKNQAPTSEDYQAAELAYRIRKAAVEGEQVGEDLLTDIERFQKRTRIKG